MYVTGLRAGYWRSWQTLDISHTGQWNIFSGANGAGKTAILEILWALHRQRSLRGNKLKTLRSTLAQDTDTAFAHVTIQYATATQPTSTFVLTIDRDGSVATLTNNQSISKVALSLQFPVVAIQPTDTELILGESPDRRAFIHRIAFSTVPDFLRILRTYEGALTQRNSLLRDTSMPLRELHRSLAAWDETFCTSAAALQQAMDTSFTTLQSRSMELLAQFVGPQRVTISEAHTGPDGDTAYKPTQAEFWQKNLEKWVEKDRRNGYTSVGPHRWDWVAEIEGISAKVGASFGQVRAITIALRLAQADVMAETLGETPLVLLDDLNSEIDFDRRGLLLQALAERKYQTWISTTEAGQVVCPDGVSAVNWQVAKQSLQRRT